MSRTAQLKEKGCEFNLLYLEDEDFTREKFTTFFKRVFKNVYTAPNGLEGLKCFDTHDIDLIVTDINMPLMDGLEFSRHIKEKTSDVPIILATAQTDVNYFVDAIEVGVNKMVMKPIMLDKLSNALDDMLTVLQTRRENARLEELSHTLSDELETKTKELNLFKDDMIAIFTHELKTPLHAIINFSEYIHKNIHKELTKSKIERISSLALKIRSNGLAQSSLIETLLDVSKYKAGKMVLRPIEFNAKKTLFSIIERYRSLYDKGVTYELEDMNITWDKKAFSMLFENFYSNALKYADSKVHITLKSLPPNEFILSIEDNGDGIEEEMREKIFGQFEQVDQPYLSREKEGTGLGLYLVKLITTHCHAHISVDESSLLGGALFNVKGPLKNDQVQEEIVSYEI